MTNYVHKGDLAADVVLNGDVAVDCETAGLNIALRDRLCVVQLSDGNGDAHLVQLKPEDYDTCENLKALLSDNSRTFLFHYGRFDIAAIKHYLGVDTKHVYCTKIASKLVRTYTDRHGLKDLCSELTGVELSKQQQCSDWSVDELSKQQIKYAASDVLYLHEIREGLNKMLAATGRTEIAAKCFEFLPTRAQMDIQGWEATDIFSHSS